MTTQAMTRLIYFQAMLLVWLANWWVEYFRPAENAPSWLAGVFGAFLLRLLIPKLTTRQHLTGWLTGAIAAFLWANSVHSNWLPGMDRLGVWGLVGFLSDLLLQIVVYLISYARDNPAEAFDAGMDRVEKVAGLWSRIKEPVISLIEFFSKRKNP